MDRRHLLGAGAALLAAPALAQSQLQHHAPALRPMPPSPAPFANVFQGGAPHHITPQQEAQRVTASPAPAGPPGRWVTRADMPIPRSEMAWATAWNGRMHVVGGYGEGQFNRAYHTVYDPTSNRWYDAAPLPRGANHVAVVADAGKVYALGGFIEQNRLCDDHAYVYDVASDQWREIARLPRPRGAAAATMLEGKLHLIGGATDPADERASIAWQSHAPMPTPRHAVAAVTIGDWIYVAGGGAVLGGMVQSALHEAFTLS